MVNTRRTSQKPPVISVVARKFLERLETRQDPLSLPEFIKQAWHVVEPGVLYQHNWHIDAISEHLTAVTRGQIRNLVINIPPRHGKSSIVAVFWFCWHWAEINPSSRWIFSSYAQSLSKRDSLKCRRVIQSPWFQERYSDRFSLTSDQNEKLRFENSKTGYRIATSVGGAATGEGGDFLINDDPHKIGDITSEAIRQATLEWWDEEMSTRGNDPKTVAKVIIMQRAHESDLSGHVLAQGGYEHLCLPMEYESISRCVTSIGWQDPRKEDGEILFAGRFDHSAVYELKRRLGSAAYAGQFQQRPAPDGGGEFKRDWWMFYRRPLPSEYFEQIIQSWDCTFKDAETSDYVVGQVWGKKGGNFYLLDQVRDRMGIAATMNAIRSLSAKYPQSHAKLVEDKANGSAVIELMKREIPGLIAVNPRGGKIARARAIAPYVESGNVWLPDPSIASWINDWVEEFSVFPVGKFDDQVDTCSQGVSYLAESIRKDQGIGLVRGGRREGYRAVEGF